MFDNTTFLTE